MTCVHATPADAEFQREHFLTRQPSVGEAARGDHVEKRCRDAIWQGCDVQAVKPR